MRCKIAPGPSAPISPNMSLSRFDALLIYAVLARSFLYFFLDCGIIKMRKAEGFPGRPAAVHKPRAGNHGIVLMRKAGGFPGQPAAVRKPRAGNHGIIGSVRKLAMSIALGEGNDSQDAAMR